MHREEVERVSALWMAKRPNGPACSGDASVCSPTGFRNGLGVPDAMGSVMCLVEVDVETTVAHEDETLREK